MLIQTRRDLSFVTRGPVPLPRPASALGFNTFNGVYLRPNSNDDGTVPSASPYCASPDIWLAGTNAIPNYQTALATTQSYASSSSNNVYTGQTNLIYVRGRNGASSNKTINVTLYYAPSGVIQSPSTWQGNVIPTDNNQQQGYIKDLAPNTVGVCDATFTWQKPVPPPPGSDHYCLFAQFNDANNSNPFPNVETALDMGALIMNDLGWGWRNTTTLSAPVNWSCTEPLTIPSNFPTTQAYSIYISPKGYVGWDAEFYASRADAKGNPIRLARTRVTADGQLLGVAQAFLDPGFNTLMTINMYSPNGQQATPGATVNLSCNYAARGADLREAVARGLVDWQFMARLRRYFPEVGVGPTAWIPEGSYNVTAKAATLHN
jgi:hypothetical protein